MWGPKCANGACVGALCWLVSYKVVDVLTGFIVCVYVFLNVCTWMLNRSGLQTLSQLYSQQLKNSNQDSTPISK